LNEEKLAQVKLDDDDDLHKQDDFWQEKPRISWNIEGHRNSKFFHRMIKIKNKTKLTSSIRNDDVIVNEPSLIAGHIVPYYKNLFSSNLFLQDQLLLEEVIPNMVNNYIDTLLTLLSSKGEI